MRESRALRMKRLELEWAAEMAGDYTGRAARRDRVKCARIQQHASTFLRQDGLARA